MSASQPGQAPPLRRRWWSISPPPDVPLISARRAYAEVLGVFAAFFGAGVITAGESLGGVLPKTTGSWAVYAPAAFQTLAMTVVTVVLVILLVRNRGISARALGLALPRKDDGRPAIGVAVRIAAWALVAFTVGSWVVNQLATGRFDVPARLDGGYLLYAATASLNAGVCEEIVVLAFVVVTLRQAGRPLPEIVAVAMVLRCSYHVYYGNGVAGIAIWAALFIWLYLRSGTVLPLIIVHVLWDLIEFTALRWPSVAAAALLAGLAVVLVAAGTWISELAKRTDAAEAYARGATADQPQV